MIALELLLEFSTRRNEGSGQIRDGTSQKIYETDSVYNRRHNSARTITNEDIQRGVLGF